MCLLRGQGLKYPLLVKWFACMVMSGDASIESIDILQPASLSPEMISQVRILSFSHEDEIEILNETNDIGMF